MDFKQEDRLNLANSNIYIVNQSERIFKAWATLPVKNTKGELVPIELYKEAAPTLLLRQAALLVEHTHIVVGKLINIEFGIHPIYQVEGLLGTWQIFRHYPSDDQAWERLKGRTIIGDAGEKLEPFVGISAGGRQGFPDDKGIVPWIATSEFSITDNPAVRGATIVSMSMTNSASSVVGSKGLNTPASDARNMEGTPDGKPTLPQNEGNPKAAAAVQAKNEAPPAEKPTEQPVEAPAEKPVEQKANEAPATKPAEAAPAQEPAANAEQEIKQATDAVEIKAMLSQILMLLTGAQSATASLNTQPAATPAPAPAPKPEEAKNEAPKEEPKEEGKPEEAKNEAKEEGEKKEEKGDEKEAKSSDAKNSAGDAAAKAAGVKAPSVDVKNLDANPTTTTPRPSVASPGNPDAPMPVIPGTGVKETAGSTVSDVKSILNGTKEFDMPQFVKQMAQSQGG